MALTLKLLGGASTLTLTDGTNYAIPYNEWAPAVCDFRVSRLAGSGPYADVDEIIPVHVRGATGAAAMTNLTALMDVIDQAQQWYEGAAVSPITIEYLPNNSNLGAAVTALVIGGSLSLPPNVNDFANHEMPEISLTVRRRGLWIGTAETPAATAAQTHPNVFSVTFASDVSKRLLPVKLALSGFSGSRDSGGNDLGSDALLFVASHSNKIRKVEAESMTASAPGSGTFSTSADATASNGNIRRLVPNSAGNYTLTHVPSPSFSGKSLYIPAIVVKNNSSTIRYDVKFSVANDTYPTSTEKISPTLTIDTSTTNPRIVLLDPVATDLAQMDRITLTFTPSGTGGAGNELDVDVMAFIQIADPTDRIVALEDINKSWLISATSLTIDPDVLASVLPKVTQDTGGGGEYRPIHKGDVYLLTTGDRVACLLLGTTGSHWRIVNGTLGSSPTAVSSTLTATRRLAYRVPQ